MSRPDESPFAQSVRDEAWITISRQRAMHVPYLSFILVHSMFVQKSSEDIPLNNAIEWVDEDVCLVILHYTVKGANVAPWLEDTHHLRAEVCNLASEAGSVESFKGRGRHTLGSASLSIPDSKLAREEAEFVVLESAEKDNIDGFS